MEYLKKHWIIILSFGFGILIATTIIQYSEYTHIDARLNTINSNFKRLVVKDSSLVKEVKFQQFKEDSYLRQIDRDTTLTLWFIAIIFGVFGLISFASFNRRVGQIEKTLQDKYKNHIKELDNLKYDVNNLKADLNSESAIIYNEKADKYFNERNYDSYVFYELIAVSRSTSYYLHYRNENSSLAKFTLKSLNSTLTHIEFRINGLEKKPKFDKSLFDKISLSIRKIDDSDLNLLISKIQLALNLKTN